MFQHLDVLALWRILDKLETLMWPSARSRISQKAPCFWYLYQTKLVFSVIHFPLTVFRCIKCIFYVVLISKVELSNKFEIWNRNIANSFILAKIVWKLTLNPQIIWLCSSFDIWTLSINCFCFGEDYSINYASENYVTWVSTNLKLK